jgi:hypothetical protein
MQLSARPRIRLLGKFVGCIGALLFALAVVSSSACGTDANDVDICTTLESARCHRAHGCDIDVTDPVHRSGTDVSSCIRYYEIACLHGLATSASPSSTQVNSCLTAINEAACSVVIAPETDSRCAWLVPSATDAGTDADADAETDAADADDDAG